MKKYQKCSIIYNNIMKRKRVKRHCNDNNIPRQANSPESYSRYKQQSRLTQLPRTAPSFSGDVVDMYLSMGIKFQNTHGWRYYSIVLPVGWEIRESKREDWRQLIDGKESVRAEIHYCDIKEERFAHVYFKKRYYISETYDDFDLETNTFNKRYCIKDSKHNSIIFRTDATSKFDDSNLHSKCNNYLDSHFPGHQDPLQCWD